MKGILLPALLAAAMLAPADARASGALDQAVGAAIDPAAFDGGRARPESSFVRPGTRADARNPARTNVGGKQRRGSQRTVVPGPDVVGKEKEPNKWISKSAITTGIKGGLIGLLIGSLFGPLGLIIGPIAGAALFYGMQRYDEIKADNAKKNKPE